MPTIKIRTGNAVDLPSNSEAAELLLTNDTHTLYRGNASGAAIKVKASANDTDVAFTDNTTGNVSTSAHGFAPKAPNDTQKFLRGDASYAIPTILDLGALSTSDATYSGIIGTVTVDTNAVGAGAILNIASDGNYDEADADAIANAYGLCLALESGAGTKKVLFIGRVCFTTWNWTVGTPIYLSTTQGTMTQTAPVGADDTVIIVGFATHADAMIFKPYIAHITHVGT